MVDTRKNKPLYIMITEQQEKLLEEKSERTNKSKSEIVREAINEHIIKKEK